MKRWMGKATGGLVRQGLCDMLKGNHIKSNILKFQIIS